MCRNLKQYRPGMAATSQHFQELRPIEVSVADIRLDLSVLPLLDVNHRHILGLNRFDNASDLIGFFRQQQIARIKAEPQVRASHT